MITISWYNPEQDIILWEADGAVSMRDYRQAFEQSTQMMKTKTSRVDVIRVTKHIYNIPYDFIYNLLSLHRQRNQIIKHQGIIVIVAARPTVKVIFRVMNHIPASYRLYYFTEDIAEAEALIAQHRQNGNKPTPKPNMFVT